WSVREALLITQLDAAEVEHAVLHRAGDALAFTRARALEKCGDDAEREMQSRSAVADLRARHERQAIAEACRRGRAAGALRDVFVNLAILVRAGSETLDRGDDHARIELVNRLPGKAHPVEHTRAEVLDQHVARLDQPLEHFLA